MFNIIAEIALGFNAATVGLGLVSLIVNKISAKDSSVHYTKTL